MDNDSYDSSILKKEWRTEPCFSEKESGSCWCSTIWADDFEIVRYGELSKAEADYIVKIHNMFIEEVYEDLCIIDPDFVIYDRNPYLEKWKIANTCDRNSCWCRSFTTVVPVKRKYADEENWEKEPWYGIALGVINKEVAQHIVKCHNTYLKYIGILK